MAPLKAIDFGLAVPFEPEGLPRSDLGLEGTPWYASEPSPDLKLNLCSQLSESLSTRLPSLFRYMAPEVLSSKVVPASDVWSAGVMAFQLLTGRFPFDDKQNPFRPSVTKIWWVQKSHILHLLIPADIIDISCLTCVAQPSSHSHEALYVRPARTESHELVPVHQCPTMALFACSFAAVKIQTAQNCMPWSQLRGRTLWTLWCLRAGYCTSQAVHSLRQT